MAHTANDSLDTFKTLYFNFIELRFNGNQNQHDTLNLLLDQFNAFNYKTLIIPDHTYGSQLIICIIEQVPCDDSFLAAKGSRLIINLIRHQNITLYKEAIESCVDWFLRTLNKCSDIVLCDILEGLSVVLKGNAPMLTKYNKQLTEQDGILFHILNKKNQSDERNLMNSPFDITLYVLRCFESLISINEDAIIKSVNEPWINATNLECIGDIFLKYLYEIKSSQQDELNYCQILMASISGCRDLTLHPIKWCHSKIGEILGAARAHMFRGLNSFEEIIPHRVNQSQQPLPETANNAGRVGRGGKVSRARKQRSFTNRKSVGASGDAEFCNKGIYPPTTVSDINLCLNSGINNTPNWFLTSESDVSDSESSRASKVAKIQCRTRLKALELLLAINRAINRHEMFGYWHSLMPPGPDSSSRSLCTSILCDPSPRCRMGALAVLIAMLTGSRDYLCQADNSDKTPTAFTPFSVILGGMISALHSTLCRAIKHENSLPVIIQILKTLSVLVQVTPYHRLEAGLLSNLVHSIKEFSKHKDTTIQVAALAVLGCIVSIEPNVPEIFELISKSTQTHNLAKSYSKNTMEFLKTNMNQKEPTHSKCRSNHPESSKSEESFLNKNLSIHEVNAGCSKSEESFLDRNALEEVYDEDFEALTLNEVVLVSEITDQRSWLLDICLGNLGIGKEPAPAPIRIESLHVLSAIGSSFFKLLENHLDSLSLAIGGALIDQYTESKLHAGRCLDSIGHAMNLYLIDQDAFRKVSGIQCYTFWQSLLIPLHGLLHDMQNSTLRSIACDCLGNIGAEVFKHFPRDRQIFVITVLFGCARDTEALVRAAAVRALAVCVVFPTLREDFGFVMDTAEAVIRLMKESNLQVKIKASWSLGNLSDALVHTVQEQFEEIPEKLMMDLLKISVDGAKSNDKVRCNAMRAVGNILRILNCDFVSKPEWQPIINDAIKRLTNTTGTMKVRWNACYALGNALKNDSLFLKPAGEIWQHSIYSTLNELVVTSPNFKVRINAAVSLSVPEKRSQYGTHYLSVWSSLISALDHTSNMDDFSEYKHRDNLVDQICLSLGHLINLCAIEDVCPLHKILLPSVDVIHLDISRVSSRLLPEKTSKLISAKAHLQMLALENNLTTEQKTAVNVISSIFIYN